MIKSVKNYSIYKELTSLHLQKKLKKTIQGGYIVSYCNANKCENSKEGKQIKVDNNIEVRARNYNTSLKLRKT